MDLTRCCDDLSDANFISLDLSLHTTYSFFTLLLRKMFLKAVLATLAFDFVRKIAKINFREIFI